MGVRGAGARLCLACLALAGARSDARNPARAGQSEAVSTGAYHLDVALTLKRSHDNVYDAKVSVTVPDACFHAGKLRLGLPRGMMGIPEAQYLTFPFKRDEGAVCAQMLSTVSQTVSVTYNDAKPKATAYAVVNGKVAGSDTKPFPRR
jgi:hypothetical protein